MSATLAEQLTESEISLQVIESSYRPMMALVRELIGVIPNCASLMEIWPTSFRTYNMLVPNALNLPFSLWGLGAPKAKIGLAMYAASKEAGCAYCTAHSCTFALRRGSEAEALVGNRGPAEQAIVSVAEGMARIPSDLTRRQVEALQQHFSAADVEWIILAIGMMGFLNKFMDGMGVELEVQPIADVAVMLKPTGWTPGKHARGKKEFPTVPGAPPIDNLSTYWRVIRQAPSAIRMEKRWTKGVPNRWPDVGAYLKSETGHEFPILAKLTHKRAILTLATILRDNLDAAESQMGLGTKALAGLVYATVVGDMTLAQEARLLASRYLPDLDENAFATIRDFAEHADVYDAAANREALERLESLPVLSKEDAAALILARAASTSPAEINGAILAEISPLLAPPTIVELMTWLSIQQLLHRLGCYYAVA